MKYTPGPWLVHDTIDGPILNTDVRDAKLKWVARCGPLFGRPHVAESEANARLIASAPDLLSALKAMCSLAGTDNWSALEGAVDDAKAAIRKATEPAS